MNWRRFETRVPGKWVLAGEHAVLRGVEAIALPHPGLALHLRFEPAGFDGGLEIFPPEAVAPVRGLLASSRASLRSSIAGLREDPGPGRLTIESTIPFGAGLGSSAALCVAVTRWISEPLGLAPGQLVDFATRLENQFHGQSSGMDVAVVAAGEPIRFVRGQGTKLMGPLKLPRFTFHDTGLRASTSECVARVQALGRDHPAEAKRVDDLMARASEGALEGLKLFDSGDVAPGLVRIAQAMERSQDCFERWGLVPAQARELHASLISQGARAAKLTGAGGGGMIVALWD